MSGLGFMGSMAEFYGNMMQAETDRNTARRIQRQTSFDTPDISMGGYGTASFGRGGVDLSLAPGLAEAAAAMFGQGALGIQNLSDPSQVGRDYYSQMMQLMEPEQTRQRSSLENRLFAQGRLGTTGGQTDFANLLGEQETSRRQLGMDSFMRGLQQRGLQIGQANDLFALGQGLYSPLFNMAGLSTEIAGGRSLAGARAAPYTWTAFSQNPGADYMKGMGQGMQGIGGMGGMFGG